MSSDEVVAIVTGGARGIGAAVVDRLSARGLRTIVCDISPGHDDRTNVQREAVDVTDSASVNEVVARVLAQHGRVDVLANIAGIHDGFTAAHSVTDELWDRILAVDLSGPFHFARAVLPIMLQQRSGAIVNVASTAGISGTISGTAYTVAKHGIVGLTRSIAALYRSEGIRCNAVCPGSVATDLAAGDPARDEWATARLRGRLTRPDTPGTPGQVADLISFLASDEASYVTGAIVPIDGGWLT